MTYSQCVPRMVRLVLFVSLFLTGKTALSFDSGPPSLAVYAAPATAVLNTDFTVKVRQNDQAWKSLPVYVVMVDKVVKGKHAAENASMCYFDFSGEVEVSVTFNRGTIERSRIRPLSYNIPHVVKGRTVLFKLYKPANLSVEVNGDIFHNLHLFANPIEAFKPDLRDTNLIFFGPGVHEIKGKVLQVPSGKTVYVAGGAILKGQILIKNARHVRVLGSGMVDQSVKLGVRIENSRHVEVAGIFCTQCFTGGSDSITIRNVKSMSYYGWGDGMNVISSSHVLIDGVFNRNSDDCTTVYGTRLGFTGSSRHVTMQNSTLWADVAHPILIGTHGNTPDPDILEDLNYINIDILDHKEAQIDYQGCLSIDAGDNNLVRNVRFENIRIEDFRQGQLFNIRVFYNSKYCTSPGRGVENVLFKDITYTGQHATMSIIAGYNENRKVKNIVFENLVINGRVISDDMKEKPGWYKTTDMANIAVGEHVEGVVFRSSAPTGKTYKVLSPDRSTSFEIRTANGQLMYRMGYAGEAVTNWSPLGLQLNADSTAAPVSIINKQEHSNKEKFAWPLGESDTITNNYNEIRLLCNKGRDSFHLTGRVYDGSVAFRYELPAVAGTNTIQKELTAFNFTTPYTLYQYHHESVFTPVAIDTFNTTCDFPATLTNSRLYMSVGEAANTGYTKAELKRGAVPHSLAVDFIRDSGVQVTGDFVTPWRTISVAKTAIGLHAYSQLNLKLNPPAAGGVPAWIKPGKLIRAQHNTQSGLDCIDFAASHNFQYILFDAGWYGAEFRSSSDPTQVIPQIDMPKVVQYGKEKGVDVILYVNYVGLKEKLDTILPLYKQWGVAGLKFGFVDGFTQQGLTWLHAAIQKVNDYGFILDIHDNYKPTGLSRTYPVLLTQEGIRGDENSPDAFHTTTLPFTRFLAGPADFTFCYPNPKNKFTKNLKVSMGQQLALTVVYFSPLQAIFWYGQPNDYTNENEIEFFKHVPTVWNESRYLAGEIGKNISVARRSGDTWFIGNATGFASWKTNLSLQFLTKGKTYTATIYEDDGKESIRTREVTVKKGDLLSVSLAPKTGHAIIIEPVVAPHKKFIHPGILHTQASLDRIYKVAQQQIMPGYGSYVLLRDHPLSASQYKMNGPYKVIARDGEYSWTKSRMEADFSASYLNALMWVATKEAAHALTSWKILEAYADSLTSIPATNDAPLLAGLEGVKIINALEILRYTWPDFPMEKVEKVNKMIRDIFLPVAETFYKAPAYTNGNWGPIVTKMYISAAIWFNNDSMYRKAINFYNNGNDNGTIRNYIDSATGQIQESGRDQGHSQLGIGALATVCEIALNQGDDLYGALDNRLLKGFEYVAKYNLGNDVPFVTWKDVTGKYSDWTIISEIGRGKFIPVYEMVYNHFVRIRKLSMPYTEQVIQKTRPEGYDRDQPAFGTLLFWGMGE